MTTPELAHEVDRLRREADELHRMISSLRNVQLQQAVRIRRVEDVAPLDQLPSV